MRDAFASAPTFSLAVHDFATFLQEAASLVDTLYETGALEDATDLDALVTSLEELLEDNGDFEEGCDLENDLLSEVDEDGAHEIATAWRHPLFDYRLDVAGKLAFVGASTPGSLYLALQYVARRFGSITDPVALAARARCRRKLGPPGAPPRAGPRPWAIGQRARRPRPPVAL